MREPQVGNLCGVCSDGAPSMLGAKSGLHTLVRNLSTKVITIHCMIHRQALASKTLFFLPYLFSIHEKATFRYVLDGKSALAWELLFPGHLSST